MKSRRKGKLKYVMVSLNFWFWLTCDGLLPPLKSMRGVVLALALE